MNTEDNILKRIINKLFKELPILSDEQRSILSMVDIVVLTSGITYVLVLIIVCMQSINLYTYFFLPLLLYILFVSSLVVFKGHIKGRLKGLQLIVCTLLLILQAFVYLFLFLK